MSDTSEVRDGALAALTAAGGDTSKLSIKHKSVLAKLFGGQVKDHKEEMKEDKIAIFNKLWEVCGGKLEEFLDLRGYSFNGPAKMEDGTERKVQVLIRYAAVKENANGSEAPTAE